MNNDNPICSYCHKPVGSTHKFSYGIPGIKRTYSCDRWLCKILTPLKQKRNKAIKKFVKQLYEFLDIQPDVW